MNKTRARSFLIKYINEKSDSRREEEEEGKTAEWKFEITRRRTHA